MMAAYALFGVATLAVLAPVAIALGASPRHADVSRKPTTRANFKT